MKLLKNRCLESITVLVVCIFMGEGALPLMFSEANAAQFKVFEHTYIRQEGTPAMEILDFPVLNPQIVWTLQAFNGGMEDGETEYEKVSSATLNVNGLEVLRTNQFNQNTSYIEEVVTLSTNNTISTQLRSKPGGCLMVAIVGEDDQPPTAVWQSPADNQFFKTQQLTASLIVADDVSGLNPQTLSITDNASDITDQFNPFADPTLSSNMQAELELTEGEHTLLAQVADLSGQSVQSALNITVDITSPVISGFFPQEGEVISNAFPLITASLSDAISGVDPDSIQLLLDGLDITSQANVAPGFVEYVPLDPLSEGAHTVSLSVSDIAGNAANKNVGFSIDTVPSEPPVISPKSGFVHGKVLDSATDSPLSRVIVSIYGVSGALYTDSDGKFSFPTPNTGEYILKFKKDGYIVSERRLRVISTRDASVGDVYMKQLDPVVTTITNEGGLYQNAAGTLQLNFP
ncbi:MAG: Ig-like domain-containing protein, partial [Candidatus Omnitrophota bacterium]